MDVLNAIEYIDRISNKAKECELSDAFFKDVQPDTTNLASFLECSERQSIWFSLVFIMNFRTQSVDFDDLANYLGTSVISVLKYLEDFEVLTQKKLLKKDNSVKRRRRSVERLDTMRFYVLPEVMRDIADGKQPKKSKRNCDLTVFELLELIHRLTTERANEILDFESYLKDIQSVLNESQLPFVKLVRRQKLNDANLAIFLYLCSEFVNYENSEDLVILK